MQLYQLHAKQCIKTDMNTAWEFLSDPKNLQRIPLKPWDLTFWLAQTEKCFLAK